MSKITERQKDLSLKFLNMGKALSEEGLTKKDFVIASLGNYLTFISTIVYSERDLLFFNQLTNMVNSRNLLERISSGDMSNAELEMLKENGEVYESIPDMVNRMHEDFFNGKDDEADNDNDSDTEEDNPSEPDPSD